MMNIVCLIKTLLLKELTLYYKVGLDSEVTITPKYTKVVPESDDDAWLDKSFYEYHTTIEDLPGINC